MKQTLLYLLLFFFSTTFAQNNILFGKILDEQTGEVLPFSNLSIEGTEIIFSCDESGEFFCDLTNLKLKDSINLCVSFINSIDTCFEFQLNKILDRYIKLEVRQFSLLNEVIIQEENFKIDKFFPERIALKNKDIAKLPTFLGTQDVIKSIQLLPQAQITSSSVAGLSVRGGDIGNNLILVDEVPIFNYSHAYGLFSTFPTSAIKRADFYPGFQPIEFQGRTASVLDLEFLTGSKKKHEGRVQIGLALSELEARGPLKKDKASYVISYRRSYIDLITKLFTDQQSLGTSNFSDLYSALDFTLNKKNQLKIHYFRTYDKLFTSPLSNVENEGKNNNFWHNNLIGAKLTTTLSRKTKNHLNLYYTTFGIQSSVAERIYDYQNAGVLDERIIFTKQNNFIGELGLKDKIIFRYQNHSFITSGLELNLNSVGDRKKIGDLFNFTNTNVNLYCSWKYFINSRSSAVIGFNNNVFLTEIYFSYTPLFRAKYNYAMNSDFHVWLGFSQTNQNLHYIRYSNLILPNDSWFASSSEFPAEKSDLISLGSTYNIGKHIKIKNELYYKFLKNILDNFANPSIIINNNEDLNDVKPGEGRSFGAETVLEGQWGNFNLFTSYVYSKTEFKIAELNDGDYYPYDYDRTHSIKLNSSYRFSKKFEINLTWVFGTGQPISLPNSLYNLNPDLQAFDYNSFLERDYQSLIVGGKNNNRLPAFHQANVGLNWYVKGKKVNQIFRFSIYNVYSKLNIVSVSYNAGTFRVLRGLPIVPFLSYEIQF